MKIIKKGGEWAEQEDYVILLAVQKYGTINWNKIASLLHFKTPSQCRQRFKEYLNPTIKTSIWSEEETNMLLKLTKRFPNQWRTISGCLEGRTAQQCKEKFENVLCEKTNLQRIILDDYAPFEETKLAIQGKTLENDPLNEVVSRLANSMGRKGIRKLRQKEMQERKQAILLTVKHELLMAGIPLTYWEKEVEACTNKKSRRVFGIL